MSILTWFRDKIYGKSYVQPESVNPQITDAVTTVPKPTKAKPVPKKSKKKTS